MYSQIIACIALVVLVTLTHAQIEVTGVVGKHVTLKCNLDMSDPPNVRWVDWVHNTGRDAEVIFDSTASAERAVSGSHPNRANLEIGEDYSLTIKRLKFGDGVASDSGEYICISVDSAGTEQEEAFQVNIGGLPECSGDTDLSEGESTVLTCQAPFSGSAPSLKWFIGDEEKQSLDMNDIGVAKMEYTIAGADHKIDGNTYTCKMELGEFVEECSLPMTVIYQVRDLKILPESDEISVNEEVKCTAKGNPKPEIVMDVKTEGNAMVDVVEGNNFRSFVVDKELQGQKITVSCRATNEVFGREEMKSKQQTYTVVAPSTTTTTTTVKTTVAVVVKTLPPKEDDNNVDNKNHKEPPPTPKPEPNQKDAGSNVVGIVAGVIIAALVIVVIVIAVVCIKRKNSKKHKGAKPVPTKEEEIKRMEDGKGGLLGVAYSEGERQGRYRPMSQGGEPNNGALPYGVSYHKDLAGGVDLDQSQVDFTENDYTQILNPTPVLQPHQPHGNVYVQGP